MRYAGHANVGQDKSHDKESEANCKACVLTPKLMREVQAMISQRNFRVQLAMQRYFAWLDFERTCVKAVMRAVRKGLRSSG